MPAGDALERQFVKMRPSELLPYAADRSDKMAQAKVNVIADSISRRGYRGSLHSADGYGQKSPIQVVHTDHYPYTQVTEGNHRVAAMNQIGYDKPVKVLVTDHRRPQS